MPDKKQNIILLVEDEVLIAMAERRQLEKEGYKVILAVSGEEAIDFVCNKNKAVHLILMDIDLGSGMDGTEAAQEILKSHDIPLLFLSSHTEKDVVEKSEKITNYGYVVKNSSVTVLDASIKMAFKLFNAQMSIKQQRMDIEAAYETMQAANEELVETGNKLVESEIRYKSLFLNLDSSFSLYDVIYDSKGNPVDYRFVAVNLAYEATVGVKGSALLGKTLLEAFPRTESVWLEIIKKAVLSGNPELIEHYAVEVDKHIEQLIYIPQKGQLAFIASDVTSRKKTFEGLRIANAEFVKTEKRLQSYKSMFLHINGSICLYKVITDKNGKPIDYSYLEINPAYEKAVNMKAADLMGKTLLELFPRTEPEWLELFGKVALSGISEKIEHFSVELNTYFELFAFSPQKGLLATLATDISVRKKIEIELQAINAKHNTMIANSGEVIGIYGVEGLLKYVSSNIEKWFGWVPNEIVAADFWETVHPNDLKRVQKIFNSFFENNVLKQTIEFQYKCKDSSFKWIELTAINRISDSNINGILLNFHDITEHKQAEDLIKERESIFRRMNENSPLGMHFYKLDENNQLIFIGANAAADQLLGVDHSLFTGKKIEDAFPNIALTEVPERYREAAVKNILWSTERVLYEDKQIKGAFDVRAFQTVPGSMVAIFADITERKQVEEKVRKSQLLLKSSLESPRNMIIMAIDTNYKYLFFNEAHKNGMKIAYNQKVEIGENVLEYITSDTDRKKAKHNYDKALNGEFHSTIEEYGATDLITYDSYFNPISDDNNEIIGVVIFAKDITERKQVEERIKNLLEEKELILKEAHHRVKNNMNTISALLRLQSDMQVTSEQNSVLQDATGRVNSMMVLYDKLYRSDNFGIGKLSLKEYIPALINEIVNIFPETVKTKSNIENIFIDAKILSSLGIIINELITNSMKYAFKEKKNALISISANKKNSVVTIIYKDNGIGLPESITIENSSGFGM